MFPWYKAQVLQTNLDFITMALSVSNLNHLQLQVKQHSSLKLREPQAWDVLIVYTSVTQPEHLNLSPRAILNNL